MTSLPANLEKAYGAVIGELGMASAAWIFVEEVARHAGEQGVSAFAERIGVDYPVADAVASAWLAGRRPHAPDAAPVLEILRDLSHVVVIGLESAHLDALVASAPPTLTLSLLAHRPFPVDWDRVVSNYAGRVSLVGIDDFQSVAGPRSGLLGFAYGVHDARTHVPPLWARALGEDVRTQFRALVGWEALGWPMHRYPRWLVETAIDDFTHFVRGEA